jgi:sugar-phosphatase
MHNPKSLRVDEILFDLDGTLIDSIPAVEEAWRQWAAAESVDIGENPGFHGRTARDIVASLVSPDRVTAAVERLSVLEQNPQLPVPIRPGVIELLAALPVERWAIVTSAARLVALARLAVAGLAVPSLLISGDDVTDGKPHPEPYFAGRRRPELGASAVAFEDTVTGLRSARAAGCITVGVLGTQPAELLAEYADAVVGSLADVAVVSIGESIVLSLALAREQEDDTTPGQTRAGTEKGSNN